MTDCIHIRDLSVRCVIGVNPGERRRKQDVLINIALYCDTSRAAKTDRIEDTVDYKALKREILITVEKSRFFLLERLAEEVAQICLRPPRVEAVEVTIDKPGALHHARSVAVRIRRARMVESSPPSTF